MTERDSLLVRQLRAALPDLPRETRHKARNVLAWYEGTRNLSQKQRKDIRQMLA